MLAEPDDVDLYAYAEQVAGRERPIISFDCGVDDQLIEENRACHRRLHELGIVHNYAEFSGTHDWDYWDVHVQEALAQHVTVLGLTVAG